MCADHHESKLSTVSIKCHESPQIKIKKLKKWVCKAVEKWRVEEGKGCEEGRQIPIKQTVATHNVIKYNIIKKYKQVLQF